MKRFLVSACSTLLLVGCTTQTLQNNQFEVLPVVPVQPPPTAAPVWFPEPSVQTTVLSSRGNGRYRVGENTYSTWHHVGSYVAQGTASWRGREFDGRHTISGDTFDVDSLTAAHRNLPIPSYVRVTNLSNGLSTTVRVVDRGPFWGNHLIDLSEAAALKLGFGEVTWRPVQIELVKQPSPRYALETNYVYGKARADDVLNLLETLNLGELSVRVVAHQYENRYRVTVSPFANTADAKHVSDWLQANVQLQSTIIRE